MCRPHKEIARDVATTGSVTEEPRHDQLRTADPRFDEARYHVAMVAMSTFRVEQVMTPLYGNSCYDPGTLVVPEITKALADAGLSVNKSCGHATARGIRAFRDENIQALRTAMNDTASYMQASGSPLTMKGLGLPSLPADPADNGAFLDHAVVYLFKGYDDRKMTYASKTLKLLDTPPEPKYAPLLEATAFFLAQTGVHDILKQMFSNKLVEIIRKAPDELKAGFGQEIDCHMCHHPVATPAPGS